MRLGRASTERKARRAAAPAGRGASPAPSAKDRRDARARWVVGCMTGTSLDGLDAALVRISGYGLAMRAEHVRGASLPLGALEEPMRALVEQRPLAARAICAAMRASALLHVEAVRQLEPDRLDLVVVHGQTVYHAPPLSWQLCAPAPIAHALQVPVLCDLRAADLAAGGQGAPITPLADHILFRHPREARTVVNLGGFCNLTRLGAGDDATLVRGGDVCACNQLLDASARALWSVPYDRDGARALAGSVHAAALEALTRTLALQARAGRSLGTGDEAGAWLERWRARLAPEDLARTACAAIAATIARAARPAERLVVAGGGSRNRALMAELAARAGVPVVISDQLGIPTGMREAIAMAVLGALCADGVPITLTAITGAEEQTIAGTWTQPTSVARRPRAGGR
jgi:anhydro-N-acetylmuramic acid kinase